MEEHIAIIISVLSFIVILLGFWDRIFKKGAKDRALIDQVNELGKTVVNLRDNHVHTLETKLDTHIQDNQIKAINDAKWQGEMTGKMELLLNRLK